MDDDFCLLLSSVHPVVLKVCLAHAQGIVSILGKEIRSKESRMVSELGEIAACVVQQWSLVNLAGCSGGLLYVSRLLW